MPILTAMAWPATLVFFCLTASAMYWLLIFRLFCSSVSSSMRLDKLANASSFASPCRRGRARRMESAGDNETDAMPVCIAPTMMIVIICFSIPDHIFVSSLQRYHDTFVSASHWRKKMSHWRKNCTKSVSAPTFVEKYCSLIEICLVDEKIYIV